MLLLFHVCSEGSLSHAAAGGCSTEATNTSSAARLRDRREAGGWFPPKQLQTGSRRLLAPHQIKARCKGHCRASAAFPGLQVQLNIGDYNINHKLSNEGWRRWRVRAESKRVSHQHSELWLWISSVWSSSASLHQTITSVLQCKYLLKLFHSTRIRARAHTYTPVVSLCTRSLNTGRLGLVT